MTIPIRFEPHSFFEYVKLLMIDSVRNQPGKHLRAVFFIGSQGTGKTWSIARMAEWIEESLSDKFTVGIKILDVDASIKKEYRAKSLWELTNWIETEDYDVLIPCVGEAGEFLPSVFLDSNEYNEVVRSVRQFFQARHYTKAKVLYYLFGAQVPKSFMAWFRRLTQLYVFKGLPRELAIEVIDLLKLRQSEELVEEIADLYDEVLLYGRKDKAIGVSGKHSGTLYFSAPTKIIDPNYIDKDWIEFLKKLRQEEQQEEGGSEPRTVSRKKVLETATRKIDIHGRVTIPRVWMDLLQLRDYVELELVKINGDYGILIKSIKKKTTLKEKLKSLIKQI